MYFEFFVRIVWQISEGGQIRETVDLTFGPSVGHALRAYASVTTTVVALEDTTVAACPPMTTLGAVVPKDAPVIVN